MILPPLSFREALPAAEPSVAEEPMLAERLRVCARLLEATAEELTAMTNGEVVKRREAAAVREDLTRELCPSPGNAATADEVEEELLGDPSSSLVHDNEVEALTLRLPHEMARLLIDALDALEERDEEERRMQDRWTVLEGDALRAMYVDGRIIALRAGRYPEGRQTDPRLDLRF